MRALVPQALMMPPAMTVGSRSAAFEQIGDQRGGGGLAVGAGDRHGGAGAHQLGQHLGAADDGNAALLGRLEFGIAGLHRAGDDEMGRAVDIGGVVADQAGDAVGAQALEIGAVLEVAALHVIAAGMHHLGDGAHADAADADDMEQACLVWIGKMHARTLHHYSLIRASSSARSASLLTASTSAMALRLRRGVRQHVRRVEQPFQLFGEALGA